MPKKEARLQFPVTAPKEQEKTNNRLRFGLYSPEQRAQILTRHRNSKLRESADAKEKRFVINGEPADRYDVMYYIVIMVSEGMSLPDLCDEEGMPTLLEVKHWRKWHNAFDKELEDADLCRGLRLGERALSISMDTSNEDNAAIFKLKKEALSGAAARLNPDFQERKLLQTENLNEKRTYDQLLIRYKELVGQFPELKTLADSMGVTEAEIVGEEDA